MVATSKQDILHVMRLIEEVEDEIDNLSTSDDSLGYGSMLKYKNEELKMLKGKLAKLREVYRDE
jgi:hypothetical protein